MKIKNKAKRDFYNRFYLKDKKRYDYDSIKADGEASKVRDIISEAYYLDGDRITSRDHQLIARFNKTTKIDIDFDGSKEAFIPMLIPVELPKKGRVEFLHKMWRINRDHFSPYLDKKQFANFIATRFKTGLTRSEIENYIYTNIR